MKQRSSATKQGSSRFRFFTDTINELKKVTWLSRREVAYLTGIVLLVVIVVGIALALVDFGFTRLVNRVFIGG